MTIPQVRDRILSALTARKMLVDLTKQPGLTAGAKAQILRDVHAEIDTILAGLLEKKSC